MMAGECDNLTIDRTHPIFKDYWGDTLFRKNVGGGTFKIDPTEISWVTPLAYFPEDSYENNESKSIYAWTFPRNQIVLILTLQRLFKYLSSRNTEGLIPVDDLPYEWQILFEGKEKIYPNELIGLLTMPYCDFVPTNKKIITDLPENPAIIAFNYLNDPEKGRVVLSSPHIFTRQWYEGEIKRSEDTSLNCLLDGLYHWETENGYWIEADNEYSFPSLKSTDVAVNPIWYFRREVAWASRQVPDDHLPPVYGRSQVVDLNPEYQDSPEFIVECCVGRNSTETWDWDEVDLSLYYKYVSDPDCTDWILWETKNNDSDYFFVFNASNANGSGKYEFCSIAEPNETDSEYQWDGEDFPPGPDAVAYVQIEINAEISTNCSHIYAGNPIYFDSSNSITDSESHIVSYNWDFGDGNTSSNQTETHVFSKKGVYNVTLNVTNNRSASDTAYKIIDVLNNFPNVNFNLDKQIIFTGETINLTDFSSDVDGEIINYTWDFDDGNISMSQNTSHSFSKSGFYEISLQVKDDDNSSNSTENCVLVIDSLVNKSKTPINKIFNNIQQAIDNSSTGDFIYVENNSYNENIVLNKSVTLFGENKNNVILNGMVTTLNPFDFELPNYDNEDIGCTIFVNMTGVNLLMHFNNDTFYGENYSFSDLVFDYSGLGFNGSKNNVNWSTNTLKGEGCLVFNGNNSSSVNLSVIPALSGENVTVSSWVYWDNDHLGVVNPVLSQCGSLNGYCLFINGSNGKPCFQLDDTVVSSSISLNCDEWHYVVGTHNQTLLKIYVDGVLQGSVSKYGSGFDTLCYIGFDNSSNYYSGLIDEVAVWNRTLLDDEIYMIYDANYGINFMDFTFKDMETGVNPCNHSSFIGCDIINTSVGFMLNNSNDVYIYCCNITDVETGFSILDSNPEFFYFNRVVDCNFLNVSDAIVVNNSTNVFFVGDIVNGSCSNLTIVDSDFGNISVMNCNSLNNMAPDVPTVTGPVLGDVNHSYTFYACTNDSNDDQILYRFDWDDGNISSWLHLFVSNETVNASHTWLEQGGYLVKVKAKDVFDVESNWSSPVLFRTETLPPIINMFSNIPGVVGFGEGVNITANATDDETGNFSGIKTVHVIITYPDDTTCNYTMNSVGGDVFEYVFSGTWLTGQYNYTISACDNAYNWNNSSGVGCFNVSVLANMSICTIKDSYGGNEFINLTDPPGLNPGSQGFIGYEFLNNGSVLHVWNRFDHYYFNTSNGIQFSNHYNKYWSRNVLMLGYYNNEEWNLVYRVDELSGFNKNIVSDNETFVNVTLWKDLSYGGYDFRLAIRYFLSVDDNELTVIPYIKNLGVEIPFVLGFAWELKDIQVDMTFGGDYIEINGTSFYLNQSLNETYEDLIDPCFYIREDISNYSSESLYLCWDENLDYRVQVKSRSGQYNAPVTLGIKIGIINVGQEKYTCLFWHDASSVVYYFNDYDPQEYWDGEPQLMVDGSVESFAMPGYNGSVELCTGNTCSGENLGVISKVELRVNGYHQGESEGSIILRPVFKGLTDGENYTYETSAEGESNWSVWFDITDDEGRDNQSSWSWSDVQGLMCDVEASFEGGCELFCSMIEIRVTYNCVPVISDPFPVHGSMDVALCPLLNISVVDGDDEFMNVTWFSNSSGSWQVFGVNNSVKNGTFYQVFSNASENGQWWYWKVMVDDGTTNVYSSVFKFYTGHQSKIVNTGYTNISGYLLIQVQFNNSGVWVLDDDTVNETSTRTIAVEGQLGLDEIFNLEEVNTDSLSHGNGTYRVYAAFRDAYGDVLVCDDDSLLEVSYDFTVDI
jgi:hypothetical protein